MDLKIKLEEEILFSEKDSAFFQRLNKKGIYTIEDFINTEVEKMGSDKYRRKTYRAYQGILKYKYLNEPLVFDVLLEKKYDSRVRNCDIYNDLRSLGLGGAVMFGNLDELRQEKDYVKMIDIINNIPYRTDCINIKNFYIEYHNSVMKQETVSKDEKESLESIKNQLVSLLKQQKELETKISSLLEKVNALEGEKNVNGRK